MLKIKRLARNESKSIRDVSKLLAIFGFIGGSENCIEEKKWNKIKKSSAIDGTFFYWDPDGRNEAYL